VNEYPTVEKPPALRPLRTLKPISVVYWKFVLKWTHVWEISGVCTPESDFPKRDCFDFEVVVENLPNVTYFSSVLLEKLAERWSHVMLEILFESGLMFGRFTVSGLVKMTVESGTVLIWSCRWQSATHEVFWLGCPSKFAKSGLVSSGMLENLPHVRCFFLSYARNFAQSEVPFLNSPRKSPPSEVVFLNPPQNLPERWSHVMLENLFENGLILERFPVSAVVKMIFQSGTVLM
jgi:hypothetical protein